VTQTVSVVLNCYNHERYIGEAIESVLAQTYDDFELILIDNGSTDGSRKIMQSYQDERIRVVLHDDNKTLSSRLNKTKSGNTASAWTPSVRGLLIGTWRSLAAGELPTPRWTSTCATNR